MGKLVRDQDERTLREMAAWYRRNRTRLSSKQSSPIVPKKATPNITFQAPSGGIPAATSFEPGSATVDILVRDTSDDEWKSSGTATVYSFANEAICADGLRLGWAFFDGSNYVAVSQLCGDDRTYADADTL